MKPTGIILAACLMLGGCAFAQKALRTLPDIAHHACLLWGEQHADALGPGLGIDVSDPEEVATAYCDYEENVRPFLDNLLAAEKLAAQRAGIAGQ